MVWLTILVASVGALIVFGWYISSNFRYGRYNMYGGNYPFSNNNTLDEKMTIEDIESQVEEYISSIGNNLEVSDIFVFKDTDYYISIEEEQTGKGAVELLINPYTGYIYPEYGPNMMWNEKYGMHGRGMMGNFRVRENTILIDNKQGIAIADEYVKNNIDRQYEVTNEGHEFYGYYTFHVEKDNKTIGMLSVNYYTGDVWYHDWHGELEAVISAHHKE